MRKFLSMLLTFVMVLSMTATVAAEETKSDDIVVLYTNDVHTYIDKDLSYDVIAAVKADLETQYNNVILVDAGDHAQGTAYGSMDKGETIIKLMNAAGYDLATLGNHEFDYGMSGCQNIVEWADYTYVSCNFYNEAAGVRGTNVLDSYKIFECGDEKVAFVGITTPESFTKSTPAYFQDGNGNYIYGIAGGTDGKALYADVQKAVDAAKAEGATTVIALGHLGDDPASQPWTSEETIANVSGLDAFIDGHSHSTVEGKNVTDEAGETVLLTQTGEYFEAIGKMVIDAETGAITTELLSVDAVSGLTPDANVKAIKDAWMKEIDTALGEVIGSTSLTFDNYDAEGNRLVRRQETNTGDFCADALYYLFDSMDMDVDVAIMNGGGVRSGAVTDEIAYLTCKEIHTFGNVACLQTITGQQLLDALEWGARNAAECEADASSKKYPDENGGFLQVSGITYEINTAIESTVQFDEKTVWTGAPTGAYRVQNVKVYNKTTNAWDALDLNAKYNLAGYNYTLRDLGDGFAMFAGAVNVLDYVMEDYMVLANYVQGFEGGVVGATNSPLKAKYSNLLVDYSTVDGSGRIVRTTEDASDSEEGGAQSPTPDEIVTPGFVPSTPATGESEHVLPNGQEVRMITTTGDSSVYVIGHPDLVPSGATFASEQQTSGAIYDSAASVVKSKIGNYPFVVYEMNLTDAAGNAIDQLKGYINVTVPIPEGMELDANETIRAYRVANGKLYKCDTAVANGQVTFATNHFSTYILVEQNVALSPKTGDISMMPVVAMILAMGAVVVYTKKRAF